MVKVSVLMPVYKTPEEYLRVAIESILTQTFSDFELLILDDCPSAPVEKVVKSFNDKRINYMINDVNMGISGARNKLIDLAKGEYLAVMDHDDKSLPERFAKQVEYLDAHPEVGVLGSWQKYFEGNKIGKRQVENDDIERQLMTSCAVWHSSSMIRKSVLNDNNIRYQEEFSPAEDYALWCSLIGKTKFHNLPEVLFQYRNHVGNTSHLQAEKMRASTYKIYAKVREEHHNLWLDWQDRVTVSKNIRLFGFLPILRIVSKYNETKVYLFHGILICKVKTRIKL